MGSSITLDDVAKAAGVSPKTVSYALNGQIKGVRRGSAERVERIRGIADRLGYRPNASARATASGRFGAVALLSRFAMGELHHPLATGVLHECQASDLHVLQAELPAPELSDPGRGPKLLRELCVDGLIVHYAQDVPDEVRERLADAAVPVIWANARGETDCVYPDDHAAGVAAVEALRRAGHRRIGYAYGAPIAPAGHYSHAERLQGYLTAMQAAGLPARRVDAPRFEFVDDRHARFERGLGLTAIAQWYEKMLLEHADVTAWIAGGARQTGPLLLGAMRCGLRVPEQLSVLAFSDLKATDEMGVPVSSMLVPLGDVGHAAVRMLAEKMQASDQRLASRQITFRTPEGDTIAPPPSDRTR